MSYDWVNAACSAPRPTPANWTRVSVSQPCPICGKPDWCSIDANDGTVICMRIAAGSSQTVDLGHGTGYLHKTTVRVEGTSERRSTRPVRRYVEENARAFALDYEAILRRWRTQTEDAALDALAQQLGVSRISLDRLGVVRCQERQTWAFPMHDERRRVVGVRFRADDNRKFALAGSHAGLFLPAGINSRTQLYICEGPTDTAAAITLGLDAIGRPSCSGGTEYICDMLQIGRRRDVVIIADADGPGRYGANQLADRLVGICESVKVIDTAPYKDLREWIQTCETHAVTAGLIEKAGLREEGH